MKANKFLLRANYSHGDLVPITGYSVGLKRTLDHQFGVPAYLVDGFMAVLQSENSIDAVFFAAFNVTLSEVEAHVVLATEMRNSSRAFTVKETVSATAAEFLIFSAFSHIFSNVENNHRDDDSKMDGVETSISHIRSLKYSMMEVSDDKTRDKLCCELKLAQSELLNGIGVKDVQNEIGAKDVQRDVEEAEKATSVSGPSMEEEAAKAQSSVSKGNAEDAEISNGDSPAKRMSARSSKRKSTIAEAAGEKDNEGVVHAIDESVIYIVGVDGSWFTCMCDNSDGAPTKKLVNVNAVADKHVKNFAKTQKSKQTNFEKVTKIIDLSQNDEHDQAQLSINMLSNLDAKVMLSACLLKKALKIVDSEMTTEFFNRINGVDSCMPLFGDQLKSSEVVKRRSAKYDILNCSCSDTELNEDFQIGAYFTTEAKQILGVFAKRDMEVSKSFRDSCLDDKSLALKGIPFSLYKLRKAGFSLEKLLALGAACGGMRSQCENKDGTLVILSLGASLATCANSAGNPGTTEARKFQKMEYVESDEQSLEFLVDDSTRTFLKLNDLFQYTDENCAMFMREDDEEGTVDNLESFLLPRIVLAPILHSKFEANEEIFTSHPMPGMTEDIRVLDFRNSSYDNSRLDCFIRNFSLEMSHFFL